MSSAMCVHADMSRSQYPYQIVGYHMIPRLDPYNDDELSIFEGTIELTNP
jgi:hypothetical protein